MSHPPQTPRLSLAVVLLVGLGGCQVDHSKAQLTQYPVGFRVNCTDWTRTERGTWVANANGTMFFPKQQGMLANVELTPQMPAHSNVNLWKFVELSCGMHHEGA